MLRSKVFLLQRVVRTAVPKAAAATAATPAAASTATNSSVKPSSPSATEQAPTSNATVPFTVKPPTASPASVVPPPPSASPAGHPHPTHTGTTTPTTRLVKRKKIIKKKKLSVAGTPPTAAAAAEAAGANAEVEDSAPQEPEHDAVVEKEASANQQEDNVKATEHQQQEEEEDAPHAPEARPMRASVNDMAKAVKKEAAAQAVQPQPGRNESRAVKEARTEGTGGGTTTTTTVGEGEALRRELRGIPMEEAKTSSGAAPSRKTPMVKGFRIDEVASSCGRHDAIFARRLPAGGCQFFAWPGTSLEVASKAIVSMPDTIRTVHAVFGRVGTPIDIVMDIDCPVPQEHWSMSKIRPFQVNLLDSVLTVLKEEIEKIGERIETQVVLQSPNLKKASFHVHTKLKDVAFEDFNSLYGFLAKFHDRMPAVDLQIYRSNGMLRMFSCMKENHTSAIGVFDDPKWNIGFPDGKVPEAAAALHSVCVRAEGTYTRVLRFDPPRISFGLPSSGSSGGGGGGGARAGGAMTADGEPLRLPVVLLPRTEREAVENASKWLRQATDAEVGEWRSWIGLGLCAFRIAHAFRDAKTLARPAMLEMLDAWTEASRNCPQKYKTGECQARWATFDASKMTNSDDWWGAYQRLGRLEVPGKAALELEEKAKAKGGKPPGEKTSRKEAAGPSSPSSKSPRKG